MYLFYEYIHKINTSVYQEEFSDFKEYGYALEGRATRRREKDCGQLEKRGDHLFFLSKAHCSRI
jgi:hypothetical protein